MPDEATMELHTKREQDVWANGFKAGWDKCRKYRATVGNLAPAPPCPGGSVANEQFDPPHENGGDETAEMHIRPAVPEPEEIWTPERRKFWIDGLQHIRQSLEEMTPPWER